MNKKIKKNEFMTTDELINETKKDSNDTLSLIMLNKTQEIVKASMSAIEKQVQDKMNIIEHSYSDKLNLIEKYTNEKIDKLSTKIEDIENVCRDIANEQNGFFKGITEALGNRRLAEENIIKEIDELIPKKIKDVAFDPEIKKTLEEIAREKLCKKNIKEKINVESKVKLGTLPTILVVVFFTVIITSLVTIGGGVIKEKITTPKTTIIKKP